MSSSIDAASEVDARDGSELVEVESSSDRSGIRLEPHAAVANGYHDVQDSGIKPVGQRLAVKTGRRLVFINTSEIDWVEACGNYVRFHVGGDSYLVRVGIGEIARRLTPGEFVRIHRSSIVHINRIKELQSCDNGEYLVTLTNGKQLSCSRSYSAALQQLVKSRYSI